MSPAIMGYKERLRRALWRGLCIAALAQAALQLFVFLPSHLSRTDRDRDVTPLYEAAVRVRMGEPLYRPWPDYGPHVHTEMGQPYSSELHLYPPFLAAALVPLTVLPFTTFASLWYIPLLVAFWTYAWCLARLALPRATLIHVLVAGLFLMFFPGTYRALSLGQVDPILWALFGLALVVPRVRGAALALSAAVKIYAGWPLLFAVKREGRRVLLPAAGVLVIGLVVTGFGPGLSTFIDWVRYMFPVIGQGTFNADNVSLSMAGIRLARLLGWDYVPGPLPVGGRFYLMVTGILAPVAVGWLTRRLKSPLHYACIGSAAVIFGPICWTSYLPILLAPIAAACRYSGPAAVGGGSPTRASRPACGTPVPSPPSTTPASL
jgi:hypothetical protein